MARLSDNDKELILADFHTGQFVQRELAKKYEVSTATINKLTKGVEPESINKSSVLKFASMVYLINAIGADHYKIGIADDIPKRIRQLQTGNPIDLVLVCTIYSRHAKNKESELHDRFTDLNIRGEWFKLSDKDVREIKKDFNYGL